MNSKSGENWSYSDYCRNVNDIASETLMPKRYESEKIVKIRLKKYPNRFDLPVAHQFEYEYFAFQFEPRALLRNRLRGGD